MLFQTVFCLALLAPGQPPAPPEIPLKREDLFPPDNYLVRAHALSATSFEVDHVYVGPPDLKGGAFFGEIYELDFNFNTPRKIMISVRKSELGIWWIKREGDAKMQRLVSVYGQLSERRVWDLMVFAPALKDGTGGGAAKYSMAAAKAEVFEKIYRAADKERLKVIDDYVRSDDSLKGAAALMLLLRKNNPIVVSNDTKLPLRERYRVEKFPKIADYVLPFSKDESLSPRVQWEVEQLLLLNKDGWKDSPAEWAMIQRWYTGGWKEKGVPWDVSEEKILVDFFHARPLTMAKRVELGIAGLANGARSDRFKTELALMLNTTERLARKYHPEQADGAFSELVRTIRGDETIPRRAAAAKLLVAFVPFTEGQRATLLVLEGLKLPAAVRTEVERALADDEAASKGISPGKAEK